MLVKFIHKSNPKRFLYINVPEPLPPTWRIPYKNELTALDGEFRQDEKPRIAVFEKGRLNGEPCYAFKEYEGSSK